jgi:hypothetical protein
MKKLVEQSLPIREIKTGHLTCGECAGLSVENLIAGNDLNNCSEEGKLKTSRACPKFQPEPTIIKDALQDDAEDGMREIASSVKSWDNRTLKAVAGALLNEVTTRKAGFYMWQPVYVRFRGTAASNYMSNFMTARVLTADKDTVRLVSDDGKVVLRYANTGHEGPSIYSVDAFSPLKEMMIEKGKDVDQTERATPKRLRPEGFEDVDFQLNTDGMNGRITSIGKMARANKTGRRTRSDNNILDLTKIAQRIDDGTANYLEMSEETGEYTLKGSSYKVGSKRKRNPNDDIELGDL